MKTVKHTNVIKFYKMDISNKQLVIIMELARGGSLRQLMEEKLHNGNWFTVDEIKKIMTHIWLAIDTCH